MAIHPTAIIDPMAELDRSVDVGAYAVIEGPVRIGSDTRIGHHVFLAGHTEIGSRCQIHPFAVIGHEPQDHKYDGSTTYCRIGDDNILREYVSVHRGTTPGSETRIGNGCTLLAGSHVAHNCVLGDKVTLINAVLLGGHVEIGNGVMVAGGAALHQFVRIGRLAMVGGNSSMTLDVLPFMTAVDRNRYVGVNVIGMRRSGCSREQIAEARTAFRILFGGEQALPAIIDRIAAELETDTGSTLLEFLRAKSHRGIPSGLRRAYAAGRGAESDFDAVECNQGSE